MVKIQAEYISFEAHPFFMPSCKELISSSFFLFPPPNSLAFAVTIKRFTFLENYNTDFFHIGF